MKIGDQVGWLWGSGIATGEVAEVNYGRTQIKSNGKHIVRNGQPGDPALIIRSDRGAMVVKLAHEVQIVKGGNNV